MVHPTDESFAELVRGLAQPDAYPAEAGPESGVRHVQTHISHVFILGRHVYKLHKPVTMSFIDFATRAERNADCVREVTLNRRLAPDVYLGIAPVAVRDGRVEIGGVRETLAVGVDDGEEAPEHCVVMQRLPDGRDAQTLIERGELGAAEIESFADLLAEFHREHALPARADDRAWCERVEAPVRDTLQALERCPLSDDDRRCLAQLRDRLARFMAAHRLDFAARARAGRIVDGHGDLHLQHIWYPRAGSGPIAVDCLEFRDDFRHIDAASDVAFLAMDLRYRDRADLAHLLLERYANAADDFDLYTVVDYYVAHRAAVRARVAWAAASEDDIPPEQRARAAVSGSRHLALAAAALEPRRPGAWVAVAGPVGSGKSTVARAISAELDGVVVSSDRVRKHLFGVGPLDRAEGGDNLGLYSAEMTEATYAGLVERAATIARAGRTAVLDATFSARFERDLLLRTARAIGIQPTLVLCSCAHDVARARVAARAHRDDDPSDAGIEVFEESARAYAPPDRWPGPRLLVQTDQDGWQRALLDRLTKAPTKLR